MQKYSEVLLQLEKLEKQAFIPNPEAQPQGPGSSPGDQGAPGGGTTQSGQPDLGQAYQYVMQMGQQLPPQMQQQLQQQLAQVQQMPVDQQLQMLQQIAQQEQSAIQQGGAQQGQGAPGADPSAGGSPSPAGAPQDPSQDPSQGGQDPSQDPNAQAQAAAQGIQAGQPNTPSDDLNNQKVELTLAQLIDILTSGKHSISQTKVQGAKTKGHYADQMAKMKHEQALKKQQEAEAQAQQEQEAAQQQAQQQASLGNLMGGGGTGVNPQQGGAPSPGAPGM